ncbi:unnamed protein product [Lactuca virosa]|uniref:Zinc finger GRF-type domain-containing protein n=1 Tax=Lactuca virosa TaxID=75947 RepID=A0AAU9N9I9_9ASTR|nr:unnamed protein product [Lactuca virosa]
MSFLIVFFFPRNYCRIGDRSSGSSSSSLTSNYKNLLCNCGEQPKIWTSTTRKKPGRHFIRYPNSLDPSKDCKSFVWVDEDLGMHWYKSKFNELHRENMELFKENMNLSKKNMDMENCRVHLELLCESMDGFTLFLTSVMEL